MNGRLIERIDERVTRVETALGEVAVKRFAPADAELAMTQKARTSAINCFIRSILTFGGDPQPSCRHCIVSSATLFLCKAS